MRRSIIKTTISFFLVSLFCSASFLTLPDSSYLRSINQYSILVSAEPIKRSVIEKAGEEKECNVTRSEILSSAFFTTYLDPEPSVLSKLIEQKELYDRMVNCGEQLYEVYANILEGFPEPMTIGGALSAKNYIYFISKTDGDKSRFLKYIDERFLGSEIPRNRELGAEMFSWISSVKDCSILLDAFETESEKRARYAFIKAIGKTCNGESYKPLFEILKKKEELEDAEKKPTDIEYMILGNLKRKAMLNEIENENDPDRQKERAKELEIIIKGEIESTESKYRKRILNEELNLLNEIIMGKENN